VGTITQNTGENYLFHTLKQQNVMEIVQTSSKGLGSKEAEMRLLKYGKNMLLEGKKKSIFIMFLEQFKNIMVVILLIAAVISGLLGELTDTFIILAVVFINAFVGIIQENKAEKALAALEKMSAPFAKVKRNGIVQSIKSEDIVPGDIVLIEAGDYIPADMRLIESANLKIEEASLTGESVPVEKTVEVIEKNETVLGDRQNMAYSGSSVTYGRGAGIVTATGMDTETGRIAQYLAKQDFEQTPLQKKLVEMGKYMSITVVFIAIVIFITGILQGRNYFQMFLTAVSLAVAAIPEGLPAIVTIVLAIGVQKMSSRNAIIRKLPAVETLGSTEIICSDKTGTLTQNKMTVKEIYLNNEIKKAESLTGHEQNLDLFIRIMALCNDSKISESKDGKTVFLGDPTETALVDFGNEFGYQKNDLEKLFPREAEIPFDSQRKLMSTLNKTDTGIGIMVKGAPDILLERCDRILIDDRILALTDDLKTGIKKANYDMAHSALRVLALSYNELNALPGAITPGNIEKGLIFTGLAGMMDPPRPEVKEAVRVCRSAGIRPIMITGDHRDTAAAIARELEIIMDESEIITGSELDMISDEDFTTSVHKYSVYARVSPEHKVRIVKAWKAHGKIVAMTGDGVNDAPALKTSDIGVGMGITGTDVSKGVSDMVLSDDNFATIVIAVEEGRKIYSNIRKFIQFLLSANIGEVLTLFIATLLNWTILLPVHILWINLVTDVFPALALGMEKAEKGLMSKRPDKSSNNLFTGGLGTSIIYQGIIESTIVLVTYFLGMHMYSARTAATMAFMTLGLIQLTHSMNVRSIDKSLFTIGFFTNRYLTGAIAISAFMQVIVVAVPFLSKIFKVVPLDFTQWIIVAAASLIIIPLIELVKLFQRKYRSASNQ
jgi:P-type Ca2+ transporter type 2C